jgi:uncharacterized RmlC-like cupin family protein
MKLRIFALVVVLLSLATVHGQQPAATYPPLHNFTYWPAAKLKALLPALVAKANERGTSAERFGDSGGLKFFLERRGPGEYAPEQHNTLDDLIFVQGGEATVLYGGKIEGAKDTGNGEIRGEKIVGGKTQLLAAGDMFVIPAGVPHHFKVAPNKEIFMMIVKGTSQKSRTN